MREVAAANPDKRFTSRQIKDSDESERGCRYFYTGVIKAHLDYTAPCCIVGHALVKTGNERVIHDGTANVMGISNVLVDLFDYSVRTLDATKWLDSVQSAQDLGKSWADAVVAADGSYPLSN